MTIELYDKATEILREIKTLESNILDYEKVTYNSENSSKHKRTFRGYIKDTELHIVKLKKEFNQL